MPDFAEPPRPAPGGGVEDCEHIRLIYEGVVNDADTDPAFLYHCWLCQAKLTARVYLKSPALT